ncbi:MAG: hypothetical protein LBS83_01985 [Holosporales bacterium]|jgi:hypothetical protein|nr:hypothetical protein [Holosporales bacterium]
MFKLFLPVGLLLLLTSCMEDIVPPTKLRNISFLADKDVNENKLVIVHMAVPKIKELYDELLKMDSQAYFATIKQLEATYPNDLEVFKWEIVPGAALNDIEVRFKDFRAKGIFIFAKYDDSIAGMHRLVLPQQSSVKVLLGRTECHLAYGG